MSNETDEVEISDILEACDALTDLLERYLAQLENEHQRALDTGDPRFVYRVERGIGWAKGLLDVMDDVLERVGDLRHNHIQLKWARQGKIV